MLQASEDVDHVVSLPRKRQLASPADPACIEDGAALSEVVARQGGAAYRVCFTKQSHKRRRCDRQYENGVLRVAGNMMFLHDDKDSRVLLSRRLMQQERFDP